MHTFFINTTNNPICSSIDALKYEKEFKRLIYIDCPLDTWDKETNGYLGTVKFLSEYIDMHNDVSNEYNLIVYADLSEVSKYTNLPLENEDAVSREAIRKVYTQMATRMFGSIVEELKNNGRRPAQKMLLLLEQPCMNHVEYGRHKEVGALSIYERAMIDAELKILNLLAPSDLEAKIDEMRNKNSKLTMDDILAKDIKPAPFSFLEPYKSIIEIFLADTQKGSKIDDAYLDLLKNTNRIFEEDLKSCVYVSELYTNKLILKGNREERVKHEFQLQSFIIDCIRDNCVDKPDGDNAVGKTVAQLTDDQWNHVKQLLAEKKKRIDNESQKIDSIGNSFIDLGLVPPIYELDNSRFGLDKTGNIKKEYVIETITEKTNSKKKKTSEDEGESDVQDETLQSTAELVESKGTEAVENWFGEDRFKLYDCDGDEFIASNKGSLSANQYCLLATELANHHLNNFDKLNMHVKRILSNYAGRSITNEPALLRKRGINIDEDAADGHKNDYKYAKRLGSKSGKNNLVAETMPTENIKDIAKRSYTSVLLQYLEFEAERKVSVTSIKEQCDWFINRIRQIEDSLRRMLRMFVALAVFLVVLYLPFVLIQWESIISSPSTLITAVASIGIPFALLFICYFIAKVIQKRKMSKAWEDLVAQSKKATEDNKKAISAFDKLLSKHIPALRWIYEYILDVKFHLDCCSVGFAKRDHHLEKLNELSETLGNVLGDLDCAHLEAEVDDGDFSVDYTIAFCDGDNYDFYSIIDKKLLDYICGKEREE